MRRGAFRSRRARAANFRSGLPAAKAQRCGPAWWHSWKKRRRVSQLAAVGVLADPADGAAGAGRPGGVDHCVQDEGAGAAGESVGHYLAEERSVGHAEQVEPPVTHGCSQHVEVAGELQRADVVEQVAVAGPACPGRTGVSA